MTAYADVETLVQTWLKNTPVAPLVTRAGGGISIFKAMPNRAPLPSIVLSRVGGGPAPRTAMPLDVARISFDCWAASRDEAVNLALTLVGAIEDLAPSGGFGDEAATLKTAETVSWLWLADKASDTPRYVVDALFTVITG